MSLHRGIDGAEPLRPEPITRIDGGGEHRLAKRTVTLATGTLACPECDAPVMPLHALRPGESLACPYCLHFAPVREFLSLAAPTRPARVEVRVTMTGGMARRRIRSAPSAR